MFSCDFRPYEGDKPFVFISYAHKDSKTVYPILERMNRDGYRIWFDDGIIPSSEWPEYIAQKIDKCAIFIFFMSPNSVGSENCRREVNFVASRKKCFYSVTLEPTKVPLGMELQLSTQQNIVFYQYPDRERFFATVYETPNLTECRREPGELEGFLAGQSASKAAPMTGAASEAKPAGKSKKTLRIVGIVVGAIVLLAIICLLVWLLRKPSESKKPKAEQLTETPTEKAKTNPTKTPTLTGTPTQMPTGMSTGTPTPEPTDIPTPTPTAMLTGTPAVSTEEIVLHDRSTSFPIDTKTVILCEFEINADDIEALSRLEYVTDLTIIACTLSGAADIKNLAFLGNVEQLNISDMRVGDCTFLSKMESLKDLNISRVPDFSAEAVDSVPSTELSCITLNEVSVPKSFKGFTVIADDSDSEIAISGCRMESFTLVKPVHSLEIKDCGLEELYLGDDILDWEEADVSLSDLILPGNKLSDLSFLSVLYDSLDVLDLSGNPVKESSKTFILCCENLTSLDLSYISLEDLSIIQRMEDLGALNLSHCGLKTLENGPEELYLFEADFSFNELSSMEGVQDYLSPSTDLNIMHNPLTSFDGLEECVLSTLRMDEIPFDYEDPSVIVFLEGAWVSTLYLDYGNGLESITFTDDLLLLFLRTDVEEDEIKNRFPSDCTYLVKTVYEEE